MIAPQPIGFAITIGTDDAWAPPKVVRFVVNHNLDIVNLDEARWEITDRGRISYCAVYVRDAWRVFWAVDVVVRKRQDVVIKPGELQINVALPHEVSPPALPPPTRLLTAHRRRIRQ